MPWLILALLVIPYFAFASTRVVGALRRFYDNRLHGGLLATMLIIPYVLAASLIFGAAHLDNATQGYPVPNLAYMLMATLAGIAYGWAWRKSGKITTAAITHTLVNWLWGVILDG